MIPRRAAALALGILLLLAGETVAGVNFSIDVLWEPDPSDDTQVYLHASNIAYPIRRHRVEAVYHEMKRPDLDYPVLAFIAYRAKADVRSVWAYRTQGHGWFEVMTHFGLRPDALFVSLKGSPGRPYGKAYGSWKEHGNAVSPRQVRDDDVRFWVSLRTVASFSGMTVDAVHDRHHDGEKIRHVAGEYHRGGGTKGNASAKHSQSHPPKQAKKGSSPGH